MNVNIKAILNIISSLTKEKKKKKNEKKRKEKLKTCIAKQKSCLSF